MEPFQRNLLSDEAAVLVVEALVEFNDEFLHANEFAAHAHSLLCAEGEWVGYSTLNLDVLTGDKGRLHNRVRIAAYVAAGWCE